MAINRIPKSGIASNNEYMAPEHKSVDWSQKIAKVRMEQPEDASNPLMLAKELVVALKGMVSD